MRSRPAVALLASAGLILPLAVRADPPQPPLPAPYATPSVTNKAAVKPWPTGQKPKGPSGFSVTLLASGLFDARWLHQLPNGDVLVAESRGGAKRTGEIALLRDADGNGVAERKYVFLTNENGNLSRPFGMALVGGNLYVANTDGLWRYPYAAGATSISPAAGVKLLDLPAEGHWTRNVLASPDGKKLYVTVGSFSNVNESDTDPVDPRRAAILEYDVAAKTSRVLASGLRNPNGLGWNPVTGALWTAVNERDLLGDNLVPDYVTSIQPGGFYGWPYYYFGYRDPRKTDDRPTPAPPPLVPDVAVGPHMATLGLAFYTGSAFPKRFRNGMFIGQRGSWNRSHPIGYRVAFVPFDPNGHVAGPPQTFLTGFLAATSPSAAYGRPVGVAALRDGSLLVADDVAGRVWRVAFKGPETATPSLRGLMLVDSDADLPIYPLDDGATLDAAKLRTSRFNVIASEGASVGSVGFALDDAPGRVENEAPFTLAPHSTAAAPPVDYSDAALAPGRHTLTATPYSARDGTGTAGAPLTVSFTIR